jgi:hypothetical protein
MLVALVTTTMTIAMAVATKTKAVTVVMWVVAHPYRFVRLACRGAPKNGLQQQSGDRHKGLFMTNQLIAFN